MEEKWIRTTRHTNIASRQGKGADTPERGEESEAGEKEEELRVELMSAEREEGGTRVSVRFRGGVKI